ncbi:CBS domain-containing protein [Methanonatronarchaeum sp. AMET6-2]|uniref:CBS domain-containing protein n=1 Tax=Methanonatronarchaeum sp. AMET6-2 TaxID=2933293 RepID=UPI00122A33FF|nr:CBS domain-containing protein [Methanonatronarchaeum sp. AMET6-2]RZN60992.1 MAG: CBS domain-containing protein [Methanonatronarchaeia archaeon]UOY10687.1 CBS domain-containing protein [Methanonatronarchaeum sp. AMET6-2]
MCEGEVKAEDMMVERENLITAKPNDRVAAVILRMIRDGVGGVPITDEDECVGIVTMRDIMFANFYGAGELPISEIMTKDLVTVSPDADMLDVIRLMLRYKIERVPVVEDDELVGLIVRNSILRSINELNE